MDLEKSEKLHHVACFFFALEVLLCTGETQIYSYSLDETILRATKALERKTIGSAISSNFNRYKEAWASSTRTRELKVHRNGNI
jgi:hypothetical protein